MPQLKPISVVSILMSGFIMTSAMLKAEPVTTSTEYKAPASQPRPEHPRPDMLRDKWLNLNGTWEFEIDYSGSGEDRGLATANSLSRKITVPFCPESELSGVNIKDFMPSVWYRRTVTVP